MEKGLIFNLGPVDDIPLGQGRCFIVKGEEIAVFRSRNGKIYAVQNQCPHRQGPLAEGIIGNGEVICPLHGHKFNLTTGQGHELEECIRVFEAWVERDRIFLIYIPFSNGVSRD